MKIALILGIIYLLSLLGGWLFIYGAGEGDHYCDGAETHKIEARAGIFFLTP